MKDNFATVMQYRSAGTAEIKSLTVSITAVEFRIQNTLISNGRGRQRSVGTLVSDRPHSPLMPGMLERLEQGISVLDVGCGMGKAMILLAEHFPNSRLTGYDISEEGIASANAEAAGKGLCNVRFMIRDAATFRDREMYDLIMTFDSVHDQAKPDAMLKNIHRALRNDGVYLMQDIDAPATWGEYGTSDWDLIYTVSCMHCMTVSLAEGGAGLGAAREWNWLSRWLGRQGSPR